MVANGRELHEFLEIATRYNDWSKSRIEKYGFVEGEDFATVSNILENGGKQNTHIFKI
jgi:anti-repressor protein